MSKTAAYNANEVAAVYMSLKRSDLLSSDEGGSKLDAEDSLKNGFFALSDPMNLRGVLETFEADFERGSNSCTYRIRILNPTAELETLLTGFYAEVFPSTSSPFTEFKEAWEKEERMNAVEAATGDRDKTFLANNEPPQLPRIYLRFGYGTNADQGLSRIHKTVVSDLKYIVSENADKVIELQMVDIFTYSRLSPSFNRRPFIQRVTVADNEKSLKRPSQILAELFAAYLGAYPECVPIIDLGGYTDDIDNLVYSVAASLAEGDKLSREKKLAEEKVEHMTGAELEEPEEEEPTKHRAETLSPEIIAQIEKLLDRPLSSDKAIDRGVKGMITQQILYQAYKLVFEQIGLKWELNSEKNPAPVTGPIAANQESPMLIPKGGSAAEMTHNELAWNSNRAVSDEEINIQTELLHNNFMPTYTEGGAYGQRGLSFWPMALEQTPTATQEEGTGFEGQVLGKITNLTAQGTLNVTDAWEGIGSTGAGTYVCDSVTQIATGGEGSEPPPPEPPRPTSPQTGLVIEFSEEMSTIMGNQAPYTREYYSNTDPRLVENPSTCQINSGFVGESFDLDTETWFPPAWYTNTGEAPAEQTQPASIKIKIMNVEGMVEVNEREFWLYQADSEGSNQSKFFLLDTQPGLDGSVDLNWFNKDGTITLSPYEQGGEVWIAEPESGLESPVPENEARQIRPLTPQEKRNAMLAGEAPLWMDAGLINPEYYQQGANAEQEGKNEEKHRLNLQYMNQLFGAKQVFDAMTSLKNLPNTDQGPRGSYIRRVPVSMPVVTTRTPQAVLSGKLGSAFPVLRPNVAPLLDLNTGELFPVTKFQELPDGDFKSWTNYASGAYAVAEQTNIDDAMVSAVALSPPTLYLEPTYQTADFVLFGAQNYERHMKSQQDKQAKEDQERMVQLGMAEKQEPPSKLRALGADSPLLEEFKKKLDKFNNASLSMGDDGTNPHVSSFLDTIINNINKLVIGRNSKMMVQPIQVNMLTEEDKKELSENSVALKGFDWDAPWVKNNLVILVLGTSSEIQSQYSDNIIRPVKSFPQTFDASAGDRVIWLDYGSGDSIVARVDFTGDTRVLINLAQSNYSVRQWHDVKALFDGDETLSHGLISNVISVGLANKISELTTMSTSQEGGLTKKQEEALGRYKVLNQDNNLYKRQAGTSDAEISSELLEEFPKLINSFQTDADLQKISGDVSDKEMRVLASVISNPNTLNWLFPEVEIDGASNTLKSQVIIVTKDKIEKINEEVKIARRRVDFDSIRNRISNRDAERKMQDTSWSFYNAMSQESFSVNLTTLGLPEIDDPASEFLSRLVFFKFYDSRLASGQLHWLSGVYRITGFKHKLNPNQGFLTELSLIKDPAYNLSNMRDMR